MIIQNEHLPCTEFSVPVCDTWSRGVGTDLFFLHIYIYIYIPFSYFPLISSLCFCIFIFFHFFYFLLFYWFRYLFSSFGFSFTLPMKRKIFYLIPSHRHLKIDYSSQESHFILFVVISSHLFRQSACKLNILWSFRLRVLYLSICKN